MKQQNACQLEKQPSNTMHCFFNLLLYMCSESWGPVSDPSELCKTVWDSNNCCWKAFLCHLECFSALWFTLPINIFGSALLFFLADLNPKPEICRGLSRHIFFMQFALWMHFLRTSNLLLLLQSWLASIVHLACVQVIFFNLLWPLPWP